MKKIGIIGDLHLSQRRPLKRKDDFINTEKNKLDQIYEIFKEEKVDYVFQTGDIFDIKGITFSFLYEISFYLKKISDLVNGNFFIIMGNHDLYRREPNSWVKAPVSPLLSSGIFKYEREIKVDNWDFIFSDFNSEIKKSQNKNSILIAHQYYNFSFCLEESLLRNDICSLGYRGVILGHDHNRYDVLDIDGVKLIRPGAVIRNVCNAENRGRKVSVAVISLFEDNFSISMKDLEIEKDVWVSDYEILEKEEFTKALEALFNVNKLQKFDIVRSLIEEIKINDVELYNYMLDLAYEYGVIERV